MHLSEQALEIVSTIVIVVFALTVIFVRLQAAKRPTSVRKIIMPPVGMSTGFLMFVVPMFRSPLSYLLIAFLVGCLFSLPLIATSHMELHDEQIYLKRSPAFILVLLGLLVIRLFLHQYLAQYVSIPQTGGLFFVLAFGMIVPWRVAMYFRYRAFVRRTTQTPTPATKLQ